VNLVQVRILPLFSFELSTLSVDDAKNLLFVSLEMGYCFYCWFARGKGSGARKGKILKNKKGKKFCDKLFCHRKGKREDRGLTNEKHKRYIRRKTRCGCRTECRVHIGINSRLRYVSYIHNGHSHELLNDEECRMLPSHRTMSDFDLMQVNNESCWHKYATNLWSNYISVWRLWQAYLS